MSRELIRAAELRGTMSTPGWHVIASIAEDMLKSRERDTIACNDETQIVRLQRKANAAREFWDELARHINAALSVQAGD